MSVLEVTERAFVPYVQEQVVQSVGLSTALVKWLPWGGVIMQSVGLYKEVSYSLTYSGGIAWLVKQFMYWCLPQTQGVIMTTRCLSFLSGVTASIFASIINSLII